MPRKLFLTSIFLLFVYATVYPTKKEELTLFDYCYSLEKLLLRNTLERKRNIPPTVQSITRDISKFGVSKTRGELIDKAIEQYKNNKNLLLTSIVPNKIYCFAGYWIEKLSPGKFESIFYEKSKQKINDFKKIKQEVDFFLNGIQTEYENIKKDFKITF